ncbi:MAG: SDR family NAD(P)-dependent oxidoreductase [Chloroflexota bacterium]
MKSLRGKIVLITGAGGGFGQTMIRQFLQAESKLILTDLHADSLRQTADTIHTALGRGVTKESILGCFGSDLGTAAGAEKVFQECQAITPHIDILVNNAGIAVYGLHSDIPPDKWELLMQVNLLAPMRLTAKFAPAMMQRRSGHIVNISSAAGLVGSSGLTSYCAAKFGLRGFGEALYADLRRYRVDVTNIYPFFARTPILQSEQFGSQPRRTVPDELLDDPDMVIAELIKGIRKRKLHVYPGKMSKRINFLKRVAPWLITRLEQRTRIER